MGLLDRLKTRLTRTRAASRPISGSSGAGVRSTGPARGAGEVLYTADLGPQPRNRRDRAPPAARR